MCLKFCANGLNEGMSELLDKQVDTQNEKNLKIKIPGFMQALVKCAMKIKESRLTIVSREAKKKQAVCDEQVSYLHVASL